MDVLREYHPHVVARYAYARHALVEALNQAGVSAGSTVLLPAFICRDVLASVHALNAHVAFYDVDEQLRPRQLDQCPAATAVLAVNYFGFPQDLAPFREYCTRHHARLIEDNAHGLFSRDSSGALLGTRGDYGILSMRKTFHVTTGSALLAATNTDSTVPRYCLDHVDSPFDQLRYHLSRLERKTTLPFMSMMRAIIRVARQLAGRPSVLLSSAREEHELPTQHAIGCTSNQILDKQDPARESERRRSLFIRLCKEVGHVPGVTLLYDRLEAGVVPYGIPFRADTHAATEVTKIVRRYHVTTMTWPALPEQVAAQAPNHYRNVWLVNFI